MKKIELLQMPVLQATERMIKIAEKDKETTVVRKNDWGYEYKEKNRKYGRYFRVVVQDGILKVALFTREQLIKKKREPEYEIYVDKENDKYITWDVTTEKWLTAKINNLSRAYSTCVTELEWQTDADRALINQYFNTGINKNVWQAVLDYQSDICEGRLLHKYKNEMEQIDAVMKEVPDIPKNFEQWVTKNCLEETMFYMPERKKQMQKMYCTHCDSMMDAPARPKRPEHGKTIKCPKCGVTATYRSWNKQKYVTENCDVLLLQRLKDDSGYILRNFNVKAERRHEKGWQNIDVHIYEDFRIRLDNRFQEMETFEYGEFRYTGITRWCHDARRNYYYGYYYSSCYVGRMYTANLKKELKKENFRRADLKKIFLGGSRCNVNAVRLLNTLYNNPYIEYLEKSKLTVLETEILEGAGLTGLLDKNKNRINEVLKLDMAHFRRFQKMNGNFTVLRALQWEQDTGSKITDHNIEFMLQENINIDKALELVDRTGMNLQRMLNYLESQVKKEDSTGEGIIQLYSDYLDMAVNFDMNIRDEIVCHQPNMRAYHDRYLEEKNKNEARYRDIQVDRKYRNIARDYKDNVEHFAFDDPYYCIVVPQKASDITEEGRRQHHCVGASDRYINNMDKREHYIIFLRKKGREQIPYYTLEVDWTGKVLQWYGAYDRKPDEKKIEKVLEKWTKTVQKREAELKAKQKAAIEKMGCKVEKTRTEKDSRHTVACIAG